MEQLTVKEALEQGYEKFVYNSDGFQSLKDIANVENIDFEREDIRIVGLDAQHPSGISSKDLAELVAEQLQCQYNDDVSNDTDSVYDAIKELDFSDMENKISEALNGINYYSATNIKLVP